MTAPSLITLFTDAGYCPRTRIGTWAMWAKTDGVVLRRSGTLREKPGNSQVAEFKAMANGLAIVLKAMQPARGAKIIAQTDCAALVSAMLQGTLRKRKSREKFQALLDGMRASIAEAAVSVEFRHVPGHAGKGTPRTAVNVACDKECRRLLKAARKAEAEKQKAPE